MRIDEADQNEQDERTFGVDTESGNGYIVVTRGHDGSLRSITLSGEATQEQIEGAEKLVRQRLIREAQAIGAARTYAMAAQLKPVKDALLAERLTINCDWCGKAIDQDNIWTGPDESTICEECYATGGKEKDVARQG